MGMQIWWMGMMDVTGVLYKIAVTMQVRAAAARKL